MVVTGYWLNTCSFYIHVLRVSVNICRRPSFLLKKQMTSGDYLIACTSEWETKSNRCILYYLVHGQLAEAVRRVVAMIKCQDLQVSPGLRFEYYKDNDIL